MKDNSKTHVNRISNADMSNCESSSEDLAQSDLDGQASVVLFGKLKFFRQNLDEKIDGVVLSDGVEVHFPPHMGKEVTENIEQGDEVRIIAHQVITSEGDTHVHVELIENLQTGYCIRMQVPKEGEKANKHSDKHHHEHHSKHEDDKHVSDHDQILAEIQAIRSLLHSRNQHPDHGHLPPHQRIIEELRELRKQLELRS